MNIVINRHTIEPKRWILMEGSVGNFLYRMIQGRVSIYSNGVKIEELTVEKGDKPIYLGIIAALRDDSLHIASVKSETPLEVERIDMDQIKGFLRNELDDSWKNELSMMINSIVINNEIESLKKVLAQSPKVDFKTPDNLEGEPREILQAITDLYKLIP